MGGNLIGEYKELEDKYDNVISKQIENTEDIYPVFREIFKVKGAK